MLTRYHFEIYLAFTGTADEYWQLKSYYQPRLEALGVCFGANMRFHARVAGQYRDDDDIDLYDTKQKRYEYHAIYEGSEEKQANVARVRAAIDALRKYYGLYWHKSRIEPII